MCQKCYNEKYADQKPFHISELPSKRASIIVQAVLCEDKYHQRIVTKAKELVDQGYGHMVYLGTTQGGVIFR